MCTFTNENTNSPNTTAYLGKKRDEEETVGARGAVCSSMGATDTKRKCHSTRKHQEARQRLGGEEMGA